MQKEEQEERSQDVGKLKEKLDKCIKIQRDTLEEARNNLQKQSEEEQVKNDPVSKERLNQQIATNEVR